MTQIRIQEQKINSSSENQKLTQFPRKPTSGGYSNLDDVSGKLHVMSNSNGYFHLNKERRLIRIDNNFASIVEGFVISQNIPNALDRLSPPLTLPSQVTFPPALWILLSSCSSSGL